MATTTILGLPVMEAGQAQKHVTHNEAIRLLDSITQLSVADRNLTAPPVSPAEGERHIVAASPTGAWTGQAGKIAVRLDGAWTFYTPKVGWVCYVQDEDLLVVFKAGAWTAIIVTPSSTFTDSTFVLQDETDNTKKAQFELSGITTGTTRAYTLPNVTGALASLGNLSQTFAGTTSFSGTVTTSGATQNLGSSTGTTTISLGGGATTSAATKTINIGTAGVASSTTNINIGSAVASSNSNLLVNARQVNRVRQGRVWHHDASADTINGGYHHSFYYQPAQWANGPTGDVNYVDDVWASGINMNGVSVKADNTKQYAAWHMESKFYQNSSQDNPYTENFLHVIDTAGNAHRPIAWIGKHNGTFGEVSFSATLMNFYDYSNNQRMKLDWSDNAGNGSWGIYYPMFFRYFFNDIPFWRQNNADGSSSLPLPYYDDGNNLVIDAAISGSHSGGSKNARGPIARARGVNTDSMLVESPQGLAALLTLACGTTQSASGSTAITANGTTTITAASGAFTEADIGRLITGTNVPAGTRINDILSATQFSVNNVVPGTATSVVKGARTRRTIELGIDANGPTTLDLPGSFSFRDKSNSYLTSVTFDFANLRADIMNGFLLRFTQNNVPIMRQLNGAGSAHLALPYLDDKDQLVVDPALVGVTTGGSKNARGIVVRSRGYNTDALTADSPTGTAAVFAVACGQTQSAGSSIACTADGSNVITVASGALVELDIGRLITGTNVPASTRIIDMVSATQFRCSANMPNTVTAITPSARTRRTFEFSVDTNANTTLDHPGTLSYRDKSNGYATVLQYYQGKWGFGAGANYPQGAHVFDAAVRLASYTIATLPNATTAGAGSIIYVSDAIGGATLGVSIGGQWRAVSLGGTVN